MGKNYSSEIDAARKLQSEVERLLAEEKSRYSTDAESLARTKIEKDKIEKQLAAQLEKLKNLLKVEMLASECDSKKLDKSLELIEMASDPLEREIAFNTYYSLKKELRERRLKDQPKDIMGAIRKQEKNPTVGEASTEVTNST